MTYPSGSNTPWPGHQPQQFGGPPQYQASPQQYGVTPPSAGRGNKGVLIGGTIAGVLLMVITIGVAVFALMPSEERTIKDLLEKVAATHGVPSRAKQYYCKDDYRIFVGFDNSGVDDSERRILPPVKLRPDLAIEVTNDRAVVTGGAKTLYLRKESGSWKICMSDMPGMPSIP
ncbi:hypothetical protein [Mycolicibacterium fortuitum]|uniref:hypothetical protein n=2 Tax=Actinomycetes TaxID=1760 RepID=UPI00149026F3|nr:hypothetical protein [Mycolicibacterium fortuitum]